VDSINEQKLLRVMEITGEFTKKYSSVEINTIGDAYRDDVEAFYVAIAVCTNSPKKFMDMLVLFFMYAYMCGQDSMAVQQSDEFKAAKKRLNYLAISGAIGVYDADQLIEDIKVVMEELK
jgi:hypothetical protein